MFLWHTWVVSDAISTPEVSGPMLEILKFAEDYQPNIVQYEARYLLVTTAKSCDEISLLSED